MYKARQYFVFFSIMTFILFLFCRLYYLQVFNFDKFSRLASEQHNTVVEIMPLRGIICDRNMEPLAVNLDIPSVYSNSRNIEDKDKEYTARVLSDVLDIDNDVLLDKLKRDKSFVWLKRKIDNNTAQEIKNLKLKGIHFSNESKRYYSNDNRACHVIGFVGMDNEGLEGIELEFADKLKGEPGYRHLIRDAKKKTVFFNEKDSLPPQNGYNIVLTIDSVVQYIAGEELKLAVGQFNAAGGSVVVMEPFSGRILALANYPDYNLNDLKTASQDIVKNKAIASVYEPGSVFKIVTASAVLNEALVNLDDEFFCENGCYKTRGRVLHDVHGYKTLTFREVIGKSSNIGTVKAASKLGSAKLYSYIERFGFGEKTGVTLPGEVIGISRPFSQWSRSDMTTIPIGQGIAVTPIQLVNAVSVIANGGYLMKPYIVEKMTTWDNGLYRAYKPVALRHVISRETSQKMKDVLRYVVTSATGRRAESDLYEMCGKTGTAQMVNSEGGYYKNKHDATFVGFAPMDKPLISVVVTIYDPHPIYSGGKVAAPVFKNIAERVLQYINSNNG
ncbi:MAG: penicillin-binding transpeptidase domain-containing protein [Candidatus Omnitrophota bacterium]